MSKKNLANVTNCLVLKAFRPGKDKLSSAVMAQLFTGGIHQADLGHLEEPTGLIETLTLVQIIIELYVFDLLNSVKSFSVQITGKKLHQLISFYITK